LAEDEARKKIDALLTSAGLSRLINGDGRILTMVGIPDPEVKSRQLCLLNPEESENNRRGWTGRFLQSSGRG
jgi:hypothetical protein